MEKVPVLIRQTREPEIPILPEDTPELERIERVAAATTPAVTKTMLGHPLIERSKLALITENRTTDRGILWGSRELEWLDLRVTKDCLARALRIMAAMIHLLEREGFKLIVEKKKPESTSAIVYGETIRFGLIERSRQVKPSPKPNASSPYSYNPSRLEPTGVLSVEIWNYYGGGLRKTWRDRESARLEEQLPKCVAGMMRIALKDALNEINAKKRSRRDRSGSMRCGENSGRLRKKRRGSKRWSAKRFGGTGPSGFVNTSGR
jgi:hypothetical protein